jgi:hypothetical protein
VPAVMSVALLEKFRHEKATEIVKKSVKQNVGDQNEFFWNQER